MGFACAAEERGFESVFFPDHTHTPVGGTSGWPSGAGVPGLNLEDLVSERVPLDRLNEAIGHVRAGSVARSLIVFGPH